MENKEGKQQSCLRGLRRYQLGDDFSMWSLNFYQEMVAKKPHRFFPYDTKSKKFTALADKKSADVKLSGTDAEKEALAEKSWRMGCWQTAT